MSNVCRVTSNYHLAEGHRTQRENGPDSCECAACGEVDKTVTCISCSSSFCYGEYQEEQRCVTLTTAVSNFLCPQCLVVEHKPWQYLYQTLSFEKITTQQPVRPTLVVTMSHKDSDLGLRELVAGAFKGFFSTVGNEELFIQQIWLSSGSNTDEERARRNILSWLQSHQHSGCINVAIFIGTHANAATGALVHSRTKSKTEGSSHLWDIFDGFLGSETVKLLPQLRGNRILILVSCGPATTTYAARETIRQLHQSNHFNATVGFDSPSVVPTHGQSALIEAVKQYILLGIPLSRRLQTMPSHALEHSGVVFWDGHRCPRVLTQYSKSSPYGIFPSGLGCPCGIENNLKAGFRACEGGSFYWWSCLKCKRTTPHNFLSSEHFYHPHLYKLGRLVWLVHPRPSPPPLLWREPKKPVLATQLNPEILGSSQLA